MPPPRSLPPATAAAPRRPRPRHLRLLWGSTWPWLVWALIALGCYALYRGNSGPTREVFGAVEWAPVALAPVEPCRLAEVLVSPGQPVRAGQVVARAETRGLELALAEARDLAIAEDAAETRRRAEAIHRLESSRRELQLEQARDTAEREVYRAEAARLEELYQRRLITSETLAAVRARAAALEQSCRLFPDLLAEIERELVALRTPEAAAARASSAQSTLALLEWRREQATFTAPVDGTVAQVFHRPGEVVTADTPILQILPAGTSRIVAFWPEGSGFTCAPGDELEMRVVETGELLRGRVVALSPDVVAVPDRASPLPDRLVRGRRVYLEPLQPCALPPGASVAVRPPPTASWW